MDQIKASAWNNNQYPQHLANKDYLNIYQEPKFWIVKKIKRQNES
jgi:hypothetical protein